MTLQADSDWANVEQIAAMHEGLGQGDLDALEVLQTPPVPPPSQAQQLTWATVDLARARASLHRKDSAMGEAIMWLECSQVDRAKQCLQRAFLDL